MYIKKREGKEKVIGAIKKICCPHVPPKNKGVVKIIPMLLWKPSFNNQITLYASLRLYSSKHLYLLFSPFVIDYNKK
jgi:hypothetical protein